MFMLRLSAPAEQDIEDILARSELEFGLSAALRYEALIAGAIRDILVDPLRPGVRDRAELGSGVKSYHLQFSRERAQSSHGVVHRPRHLLLFRIAMPEVLEMGRVLHDAMEIERHIPEAFGESPPDDDKT